MLYCVFRGRFALIFLGACFVWTQQTKAFQQRIVQPGAPGKPGKILSAKAAAQRPIPAAPADIEFMQGMIVHHAQAVEMVDLLLTRSRNQALLTLGKRISISQTDEIEYMKQWLRDQNQPITPDHGHMHHHMGGIDLAKQASGDVALMPGMLSPNQMKALARARGSAFDRLFLTGMIQHHTGALDMVEDLFAIPGGGQDSILFDFATDIDNTQRAEIKIMQGMLSQMAAQKTSSKGKK